MTDNANAGAGGADNAGAGDTWFKGAAPELLAHMQTHGWDKKTANEAALAAVQSHYSASKLIGRDPATLIAMPKNPTDQPAFDALYEKLGVPKEATGYKFEGLKFADGKEPDKAFLDNVAKTAIALKLTPNQAQTFAQERVKEVDGREARTKADFTAAITKDREDLEKNWGAKTEENMFRAGKAARALGIDPAAVDALQKLEGVGYAKVMEMFRVIEASMGEAPFLKNAQQGGGPQIMSLDQAHARKADLIKDTAWVQRYRAGGKDELAEMLAVNTVIASGMGKPRQ